MRVVLHLLTRPEDSLAREVISRQKQTADFQVEVVDLTQPEQDYEALVDRIFAADSVQAW
jgi:hypothetical protein